MGQLVFGTVLRVFFVRTGGWGIDEMSGIAQVFWGTGGSWRTEIFWRTEVSVEAGDGTGSGCGAAWG